MKVLEAGVRCLTSASHTVHNMCGTGLEGATMRPYDDDC